jgi:dTMP kinase
MTPASSDAWLQDLRGRFVVFDGPDGSGKTTQFRRFLRYAEQGGLEVCQVREPGGTVIGEQVRTLLLDPQYDMMDVRTEVMLYMASRAQLVAERVGPDLARGCFVLADRFISSTLAYQGTAGGIGQSDILQIGRVAVGNCWPDLIILFDVDEATAAKRLNPLLDRVEQKGAQYHRRVRQGYLQQAEADPQRYAIIDARPDVDTVFATVVSTIRSRLGK